MENVEVVKRGEITVNIYEGQKGAPGEPGKSLRFEDLTPEQKASLKGEKGDKGETGPAPSLDNIYNALKYKGYKAASNSIEDVIQLLVDKMNFSDIISNSTFNYSQAKYGNTSVNINVQTAPGAKLVEAGTENTLLLSDSLIGNPFNWVLSKPMDEHDRVINLVWDGQIRRVFTINGVKKISVPPLLSHIEYQAYSNVNYVTAVKDDGKTLYFKPTNALRDLIDIVDLVNIAKDENNLPTNIETLVLIIGQPITLDNVQKYKTIENDLNFTTSISNDIVNIPMGSCVIDLRKLKVNCKNVIIVMDQQILNIVNQDIITVYVVSDKQESISGATVVNGEMTMTDTVGVSNLSATKLTYNTVELLCEDANDEHL